MSRRLKEVLEVKKNGFKKDKDRLLNSLSNVEKALLTSIIKHTTSLSDKARYAFFCMIGLIPDYIIEAMNKGEVCYLSKATNSRNKKWLKEYISSSITSNTKYILVDNLEAVEPKLLEEYIIIMISKLPTIRLQEATILKEDVYSYISYLGGVEIHPFTNDFLKISINNMGSTPPTIYHLRYNQGYKTWEFYMNEEINRRDDDNLMKLCRFFGINSESCPDNNKALMMILCYIIPNSMSTQRRGSIRFLLDKVRVERVNIGVSDPVVDHYINNKVACLRVEVQKDLFLYISGLEDRINLEPIARKYRDKDLGWPVLVHKSGKKIIINPPAEMGFRPKEEILISYLREKYPNMFNKVKEYGLDNLDTLVTDSKEFRDILDEIHGYLFNQVKLGKYKLLDVFDEVGNKVVKLSKIAARATLVTVPTATILSTKEKLVHGKDPFTRTYLDKIIKKNEEADI